MLHGPVEAASCSPSANDDATVTTHSRKPRLNNRAGAHSTGPTHEPTRATPRSLAARDRTRLPETVARVGAGLRFTHPRPTHLTARTLLSGERPTVWSTCTDYQAVTATANRPGGGVQTSSTARSAPPLRAPAPPLAAVAAACRDLSPRAARTAYAPSAA